ncbi:PucR family transcriptional regulator [Rhizohabitans arisaemae]|uniref:PucR family transcriptional regulator n=1 Tax=Rhizohabitans arisaemae TaxID=2720610 RepID=UPI0024B2050A|nr:helix-turn-helix domain-containing protein [Rhizohabitans arisaemae]
MQVITVSGLAEALGPALLRLPRPGADRGVRDVAIAEPGPAEAEGVMLLAVGVEGEARQELLDRSAAASCVVFRSPLAPDLVAPDGVAVAETPTDVTWTRLLSLLWDVVGRLREVGGGTLFSLADDIAEILQGAVTVEDVSGQVVAYSARQEPSDAGRISSIVGRRIPGDAQARLRSAGVYRRLARETDPVYVPSGPHGRLPRLVIPVRHGGELIGTVWTIVAGPVAPSRLTAVRPAVAAVTDLLLRLRSHHEAARRLLADRLRTLIMGGAADPPPPSPGRVAAVRPVRGLATVLERAGWRTPLATWIDDVGYALVTEQGDAQTPGSWAWLRRVAGEAELTVAGGGAAVEPPVSRDQAAELLGLLEAGQVEAYENAWQRLVLKRVSAARMDLLVGGPLPTLVAHDAAHGTDYVATLRAWLWEQGNPSAASARLHVHPNTFRYRMRRLLEAAPCDLSSAEVRLALTLQLVTL